jgi:hypothetical protein
MGTGQAFVLLETAATLFMAGVLWTMQLLNYPLLALVGTEAFPRYEAAHNRRFALVVVPGILAAACGGRYRPVDVPSGVYAVSGHTPPAGPGAAGQPRDHDQRGTGTGPAAAASTP